VCGLLHGRMSSEDKLSALQAFAAGHTQVLIATSVVEVGANPGLSLTYLSLPCSFLTFCTSLHKEKCIPTRARTYMWGEGVVCGLLHGRMSSEDKFLLCRRSLQDPGSYCHLRGRGTCGS
jgi:superfamily II DNA/RNA helicase